MAISVPPPSRQAYSATDTRLFDLTAAGCGVVTMEGLAELVEQHPEVEAVFTAAGAQAGELTRNRCAGASDCCSRVVWCVQAGASRLRSSGR